LSRKKLVRKREPVITAQSPSRETLRHVVLHQKIASDRREAERRQQSTNPELLSQDLASEAPLSWRQSSHRFFQKHGEPDGIGGGMMLLADTMRTLLAPVVQLLA
jgi:hypothetical protein